MYCLWYYSLCRTSFLFVGLCCHSLLFLKNHWLIISLWELIGLLDSLYICRPRDVPLRVRQYSSIVILSSFNIGLFLPMQLICNSKSSFLAAADDSGEIKVLAKNIFGGFFSLDTNVYLCWAVWLLFYS